MNGSQSPAHYYRLATLVSRCAEIFSHIGIQVRRNIQTHRYPGAQKYSATSVSRCSEIFSHIGIENMSTHATSPQLFWSVLTGGAWSEEKLENCQSRYCGFSPLKGQGSKQLSKQMQPGPETKHTIWTHHTTVQGLNPPKGTAIHWYQWKQVIRHHQGCPVSAKLVQIASYFVVQEQKLLRHSWALFCLTAGK